MNITHNYVTYVQVSISHAMNTNNLTKIIIRIETLVEIYFELQSLVPTNCFWFRMQVVIKPTVLLYHMHGLADTTFKHV